MNLITPLRQPMITVKWAAFFLFLGLGALANAQDTWGIKGFIVDSSGAKVAGGNVIVLSPVDSTVLKGTPFWEGSFELQGIEQKDVLLKVTALGYREVYQKRRLGPEANAVTDVGTIVLPVSSTTLSEVEITYRVPMFERQIGKLAVNVEGTILSAKGTVIDVLKSAPNVIVRSNGEVAVAGKGAAILYLDGQRVNSLDMLAGISSRDIKRVDVIENPSSRYDAQGNAVIEIITRKSGLDGYQGSVYVEGDKRTNYQLIYGGNLSYRKKWFSAYFACAQMFGTYRTEDNYYRRLQNLTTIEMENKVNTDTKHDFDAGMLLKTDYRLDSANTLFLNYNGVAHNYSSKAANFNNISENGTFVGNINSRTIGNQDWSLNSITGGYRRSLDTAGSSLKLTGQYTKFNFGTTNDIDQVSNFGSPLESMFRNENSNHIDVYTGQLDYSKHLKHKLVWDSGVKNSLVTNRSGINFRALDQGEWVIDSTLYNNFDFRENILAGYSEVSGGEHAFTYLLGLRYEWTKTEGSSFTGGDKVINRNFHNLFPNVQLNYKLIPDLVAGLSYVNRITRPSYQDLDPFVNFIDSLSSIRGNPLLLPSYSHAFEVSLVYMEYASLKLGYTRTKDPIFLTLEQNPGTNTFSAVTRNIESSDMYTIGVVLPYELPWWTTFNSFTYNLNSFTYRDENRVVANDKPGFNVNLYDEFRFPHLFSLELTYDYTSPGSQGIFIMRPTQSFGASITRNFFKDKLAVRLSGFDLFYKEIESGKSEFGSLFVDYSSKYDTRRYALSFTWNFGKLKMKDMVGSSIDSNERSRIKGQN